MGIRFACHVCERRLNIKQELAGRRGICPVCAARIRIPLADTDKSTPVDQQKPVPVAPAVTEVSSANPPNASVSPESNPPIPESHSPESHSWEDEDFDDVADSDVEDDSLIEDVEAIWYVRPPSGGQYGPATREVLRQWIEEGRVATTALLWREGWPQWRDASEALPEFADQLPEAAGTSTAMGKRTSSLPGSTTANDPASPSSGTAGSANAADLEAVRRAKYRRRIMTISLLSVVALSLILMLAFFASR